MKREMRREIGMIKSLRFTRPDGTVVEKVFDKPVNFWMGLALAKADKPPKS
jgi:hypothetical protein